MFLYSGFWGRLHKTSFTGFLTPWALVFLFSHWGNTYRSSAQWCHSKGLWMLHKLWWAIWNVFQQLSFKFLNVMRFDCNEVTSFDLIKLGLKIKLSVELLGFKCVVLNVFISAFVQLALCTWSHIPACPESCEFRPMHQLTNQPLGALVSRSPISRSVSAAGASTPAIVQSC